MENLGREEPEPGLCGSCSFARVIENARDSRFYLCRRAETDPAYRKYPRLPVPACEGFERRGGLSCNVTGRAPSHH